MQKFTKRKPKSKLFSGKVLEEFLPKLHDGKLHLIEELHDRPSIREPIVESDAFLLKRTLK